MNVQLKTAHVDRFQDRHIGPDETELAAMLKDVGYKTLDELVDATVPASIRLRRPLELPRGRSEFGQLADLEQIAAKNDVWRSYIGMGYHGTFTPPVILRNVLLNPGWYTQYTPYQAEISQGRLEALLNYQTMVMDLTGLEIANASLLDEGTAAAEAMTMAWAVAGRKEGGVFLVADDCHPQTIDVIRTRARPLGIEVAVADPASFDFKGKTGRAFGALWQYPATDGDIYDLKPMIAKAHEAGALAIVAADILALTLLTPPGELGADVAVGSTQRFGVPMGYGGPHAAYFATKQQYVRQMPGRLIGVAEDAHGRRALRMALQTREQHIRREKATSNICTAQVLLAVMASMYAIYHGPKGLKAIAERVHVLTALLAKGIARVGFEVGPDHFFDTFYVRTARKTEGVLAAATSKKMNFRRLDEDRIAITLDETTTPADVEQILSCFAAQTPSLEQLDKHGLDPWPESVRRKSAFLTHPVFNTYRSETDMQRYIRMLEGRDLSLTHSMIPLGSCTMKLNAAAEMEAVTWKAFNALHPFAPAEQALGYAKIFEDLEKWLSEITGFAAISLQPNAGSQGEYAGLLVIRKHHESRGEAHRNVVLIPSSAHGTNPASAVMAGYDVVVVACDDHGNIELADLEKQAKAHSKDLAALMVTYPSTHGVFEEGIQKACEIVHANGGQVYMDGANMNAQVGLTRPADIGADVCHLNLHKTFCLAAGTQVTLADGVARPIEQLLPGRKLYGWSEDERGVRSARLDAVFRTGKKECVQVTLQDGRKVVCTPDHRVLTTRGWVEAGQLTSSHQVVVGPEAPFDDLNADLDTERAYRLALDGLVLSMAVPEEREKTLAFFRLLGAVCSDGSYVKETSGRRIVRLNFGTRYDANRAIDDIALLTGARPAVSTGNGLFSVRLPSQFVDAIASVPGMGEPGKRVVSRHALPHFVDDPSTPLAILREFMGALFGGDGSAPLVMYFRKSSPTLKPVKFCQTRVDPAVLEILQRQLCAALGRMGITSMPERITSPRLQRAKDAGLRPRWTGGVVVVDSLAFAERIGFRYCAHKTARLTAAAAFWRMKSTIKRQRMEVATRAIESVAASGVVHLGPKRVWSTAVAQAYREVASEQYVLNPYYASFSGSDRLSKQHLVLAVNGQKGLRSRTRSGRRTHNRLLAAPVGRGGETTGVPSVPQFLADIGAANWFNAHTPKGTSYKVTYATSREATAEPTINLRVLDVRPAGTHDVYDLTVAELHSFLANGAVVHNCIPHGGGGPGVGPIGVAKHLVDFLPASSVVKMGGKKGIGSISAAPWGSASILLISWAYISMMGGEGLTQATKVAILNANYVAKKLHEHFPLLYAGKNGTIAHECILDTRNLKKTAGVEVEDIAKRLMDYGFHAPTISFPVSGTVMIEPTESESKAELDRFIDAMISIRREIADIESGKQPKEGNLLKNAPHTAEVVTANEWKLPYTREQAAFPAPWVKAHKFWPAVSRINAAAGDRHLICSCPPIETYAKAG